MTICIMKLNVSLSKSLEYVQWEEIGGHYKLFPSDKWWIVLWIIITAVCSGPDGEIWLWGAVTHPCPLVVDHWPTLTAVVLYWPTKTLINPVEKSKARSTHQCKRKSKGLDSKIQQLLSTSETRHKNMQNLVVVDKSS